MRIGFLGTGAMGLPMAQHLLRGGHELRVWNRSEGRTKPLLREGAIAAGTPAEAELGADAVFTMLFDDAAVEDVLFGAHGMMDALSPGVLHVVCSTISVALSERLTTEHARRGIEFVAAPVFGRPAIAEQGRLWSVVAGTESAVARARPLLETYSRGISVVGREPRQAHAVKLGGNFLISAMIQALSEAFVYAEGEGIVPQAFFDAVNSALFQSPFYASYADVMLHPPEQSNATVELGAKDLDLFRQGTGGGSRLLLAETLAKVFDEAGRAGLRHEDWAVGQYRLARNRAAGSVR